VSHALRRAAVAAAALTAVVVSAAPALAHEHRTIGAYAFTVGWKNEPTYSGFSNAVQLFLADAAGKPVTNLGDTLNVTPVFNGQKGETLPLHAAFGATYGTQGEYDSALTPTRPGTYAFHFTGSIAGQNIDETFTSSEKTFSNVADAGGIQFPARDPSNGELAAKLTNLDPRIASLQAAQAQAASKASRATTLGVLGIVVGLLGIVVAAVALKSGSRRRAEPGVRSETVAAS
jgi:hypothetical protein